MVETGQYLWFIAHTVHTQTTTDWETLDVSQVNGFIVFNMIVKTQLYIKYTFAAFVFLFPLYYTH